MDLFSQLLVAALLWGPAVYGAVLVHEVGHAVALRRLGYDARIRVYARQHGEGLHGTVCGVPITLGRHLFVGSSSCGARLAGRGLLMPMPNSDALVFAAGGPIADALMLLLALALTWASGLPVIGVCMMIVPMLSLLVNLIPVEDRDGAEILRCWRRRAAWQALPATHTR